MKRGKIDCFKCSYFYITWEERFPYGCKGMGFRSKEMPAMVVRKSSGAECLRYSPKKGKK